MQTLEQLGVQGWAALKWGPRLVQRSWHHRQMKSQKNRHDGYGVEAGGSSHNGRGIAPEIRPEQSIELLKELHILTREGKLNQDSGAS